MIPVKHRRRKGFWLIKDRLTYGRRIPWRTNKREIKQGRDITWTLRAMPAPEWVIARCQLHRRARLSNCRRAVTDTVETLVCNGKTLRGSIDQTAAGAAWFIAQVSLYSNSQGVAIAQSTYATDAGGEIAALRLLLDRVALEGLLVQADALHANRPFSSTSSSGMPTS